MNKRGIEMKKEIAASLVVLLIAIGIGYAIRMQPEPEETDPRFTLVYTGWVNGYGTNVEVIHDNKLNVTCYVLYTGTSCIPDHMLTPEGYNADNI